MDWIERLTELTDDFAAELAGSDLSAAVPSCPGWTLADLGEHLRRVHLWAAYAVSEGRPDGMPDATTDARPAIAAEQLVEGYPAAAAHLVDVLSTAGPDDPAWTFGPDRTAGFWRRRQVHETLVHVYDAMLARGSAAAWDPEPELAWDGVDEVATLFYPRQVRLDRTQALTRPLRLIATDADRSLVVGEGEDPLELALPAADLLLVLWKRQPVADAEVSALLEAAALTP